MKTNEVKKLISLIFMAFGAVTCLFYAITSGVYVDEFECVVYDWNFILMSFIGTFWPVLGIGLILFYIADRKE